MSTSSPVDLTSEDRPGLKSAVKQFDAAVAGLRRAGSQDYIPSSLLTRALCFFLQVTTRRLLGRETEAVDCEASAQRDLDEAWEIAERGPMPLVLADIHLHRARLFHTRALYPWATDPEGNARGPQDDLAAARRLIEKHGYLRRQEELEDAEEVVKKSESE